MFPLCEQTNGTVNLLADYIVLGGRRAFISWLSSRELLVSAKPGRGRLPRGGQTPAGMAAAVSTTTAMLGRSLSRGILSRNAPALVSRSLVTRAGIHLEDRLSDSSARPAGRIHSRHERRYMGLMSRFSNLFSGSWTAEDMRELERAANSRPGDVTSQALFTHALLRFVAITRSHTNDGCMAGSSFSWM